MHFVFCFGVELYRKIHLHFIVIFCFSISLLHWTRYSVLCFHSSSSSVRYPALFPLCCYLYSLNFFPLHIVVLCLREAKHWQHIQSGMVQWWNTSGWSLWEWPGDLGKCYWEVSFLSLFFFFHLPKTFKFCQVLTSFRDNTMFKIRRSSSLFLYHQDI